MRFLKRAQNRDAGRVAVVAGHLTPLAIAALVIGVLVRFGQFLSGRSLWIDEAMLALSIGTRSYAELASPLDYHQTAPIGYLWAVKAVTSLAGMGEQALRAISLVAGCFLLVALFGLARRVGDSRSATVALLIGALTPSLIYYSNELKPYALDALIVAALIILAIEWVRRSSPFRTALLWAAGMLAVWLSATAIFALAGIASVIFVLAIAGRQHRQLPSAFGLGMSWLVSFAVAYRLVYRSASDSFYMSQFWDGSYLDVTGPAGLATSILLVVRSLWGNFVGEPLPPSWGIGGSIATYLVGAFILGMSSLGVSRVSRLAGRPTVSMLLAPAIVTAGASVAGLYPLATRLTVFLIPLVVLLYGAGVAELSDRSVPRLRRAVLVAATLALPVAGLNAGARWAVSPVQWAESRQVITELEESNSSERPVYIYSRAIPTYAYYTTDWSAPDVMRLEKIREMASPGGPAFENERGNQRLVRAAGDQLVIAGRRAELMGLPTGMQWAYRSGFSQAAPNPGWAINEARRIEAAADGNTIWLCFIHSIDRAHVPLMRELEALGGVRKRSLERHEAGIYEYAFAPAASEGE